MRRTLSCRASHDLVIYRVLFVFDGHRAHRTLTASVMVKKAQLFTYLDTCSEGELIEDVLLPLVRQLGFHRITAAGHRDKALEYGKDVWMKYAPPTLHILCFGIQAKKGNLDATKRSQVMFMDRDDIINLFVTTNLPVPMAALPPPPSSWDDLDDDIPF